MNSWLKVALYAFIGAVIGSFLLGIISTGNGYNNGYSYGPGMPYMNSYDPMQYGATSQNQMPMHGSMMQGGMGMKGGMGMMRR